MMETIVQWATILSPIIAVLIAWLMIKSSANDTATKIAALEESTNKQIESIKKLTEIQLNIKLLEIQKDLEEAYTHYNITSNRVNDDSIRDSYFNYIGGFYDSLRQKEDRKRDFSDMKDFYTQRLTDLQRMQSLLADMRKQCGGK